MHEPRSALSRRALLGGGLFRGARARFDAQAAEARAAEPPPLPRWAAEDWASLTLRAEAAAEPLLAALALEPGERMLDVAAGENPLGRAAAERGVEVALAHPGEWRLPFEDGGFDVAASLFGVIHAPDHRGIGRELARVLRPGGGRLAIATWASAGAPAELLRLARGSRALGGGRGRPERWGSYEGLTLALDGFPGFTTEELVLTWRFAGADELWEAVSGPLSEDRRPQAEERLAPYVRDAGDALELRVDVVLATAVRG